MGLRGIKLFQINFLELLQKVIWEKNIDLVKKILPSTENLK